jgi:hypothetical protein
VAAQFVQEMSPIKLNLFFSLNDHMSPIDEQPNFGYRYFYTVADLRIPILVILAVMA